VINLERSKDRLEHITAVFQERNLVFIRVLGVDGSILRRKDFRFLTSKRNWPLKLTYAEVACFLSHRECLRLIGEGPDAYGAIFEDDIILSPNAPVFLKQSSWIPFDTDMIKLDTAGISCLIGRVIAKLEGGYSLAPLMSKHYCAAGYIVSKRCAQWLYKNIEYAIAPIDEIYFNPDCDIMHRLNIYQMIPAPVMQAGLASTIRTSKKEIRLSSNLSMYQKIRKECKRFKKRYCFHMKKRFLFQERRVKVY
jgi:glycosyl transferase family 25